MKILLIHQNFPGQFRQLVPHLLSLNHELVSICSHDRQLPYNLQGWRYKEPDSPPVPLQLGPHLWYESLQRAASVASICSKLDNRGWVPDCILAHTGWGEPISIAEVWPTVPQILWPELWTRPEHCGYGLDPTLPAPNLTHRIEQTGRNALTRVALDQASAWVMPTVHQAESLPDCFKNSKLHIIHEGIDTNFAIPNPDISFSVNGVSINRTVPCLTFVNRNLERLRGFDQFMNTLPLLQSRIPGLRIFIVGDNEKGYGNPHPSGRSLRDVMLSKLGDSIDHSHIHFLGRVPHVQLIALLQVSSVHVYLSYPFVLGWSLLEAMACGCAIVASTGMPVSEVIDDGVEGLLVPITNIDLLCERILYLFSNPQLRSRLGSAARTRSLQYDQSIVLPQLTDLIEGFAND